MFFPATVYRAGLQVPSPLRTLALSDLTFAYTENVFCLCAETRRGTGTSFLVCLLIIYLIF